MLTAVLELHIVEFKEALTLCLGLDMFAIYFEIQTEMLLIYIR